MPADIDTLESILDTIAFGDIEAEDTRNFTEFNFVKIFRLSQLMVSCTISSTCSHGLYSWAVLYEAQPKSRTQWLQEIFYPYIETLEHLKFWSTKFWSTLHSLQNTFR
jgi:hypothetical protein